MYNRYVRNDAGRYERIPTPDPPPREEPAPSPPGADSYPRGEPRDTPPPPQGNPPPRGGPPPAGDREKRGLLSGIFNRLHLENIDTGDLLLLVLLFLLFQEGEDEELLIALGLLLIL